MPQAKHTFVESKMNKDLDDRLLSGGQYRNAINIAVSKSDDSNVGALENVLGNYNINNLFPNGYNVPIGAQVIGSYFNIVSDDIFVFLTNFIDPLNPDNSQSKTNAYINSSHFINVYNIKTQECRVLVTGSFLNFSINNKVLGIDIAEDFLFWTDNRNQPRKINWKTAYSNSSYYNNEDTISIVKYAPYKPITVQDETVIESPIQVSTATSMEIEVYNISTNVYEYQDVIEYLGDTQALRATRSPYSEVSITNGGIENIPLYTYFRLENSSGGESGLFQVMAKEFSQNVGGPQKFYTWPRITTNVSNWTKITFFNLNMIDASSSHLPPSARFVLNTGSNYVNISSSQCLYRNNITDLQYLNGGTIIDLGDGEVGDTDNIDSFSRASKYGLPLGLFGSLVGKPSANMENVTSSDYYVSTGLKIDGQWVKTRITSNAISSDSAQACFLINTDESDVLKARATYGLPSLSTQPTPNWNMGINQSIKINKGQHYFDLSFPNPNYKPDWAGDKQNLKEKFVRFAYRFKYDDGEYSVLSPFTQPLFIPEQDGFFIDEIPSYNTGLDSRTTDQLLEAGQDTIVKFMENKCNDFRLDIPLEFNVNELHEKLKIKEIDILYKESDGALVKLIETIELHNNTSISNNSTKVFSYSYQSSKPFKNLPSTELIRTSDKAPIKALSQAISGNRVIYGNFVDKHGSPNTLDYETSVSEKTRVNVKGSSKARIQYPNHTLKQNRTYQVGVVLSDRYGRQTDVILSPPKEELTRIPKGDGTTLDFGDSTIYSKYKPQNDFRTLTWVGDSLKLLFNSPIPSSLPNVEGYPGLYNGDPTSLNYNPLGFYSYKVVVKQKEQDYYNVFVPSLMLGQPRPPAICKEWGGIQGTDIIERLIPGVSQTFQDSIDTSDLKVGMTFILKSSSLNGLSQGVGIQEFVITDISTSDGFITFSPPIPFSWGGYAPAGGLTGAIGGGSIYPSNNPPWDENSCTNNLGKCYQNTTVCFTDPSQYDGSFMSQTMTTTLLGDNINKVPADLTEVRANQSVYGSSDLGMIPRVATRGFNSMSVSSNGGSCYYKWVAQVDPGTRREIVTMLGNWTDMVSEEYSSNLYEESKNPVVAIMSNTFRLGVTSTSDQYLAVFETEPVISNLDIFWETSTSGLISELNEAIGTSDDPNSMVVQSFNQSENTNYDTAFGGQNTVVLEVAFKDVNGDSITTLQSVALLTVTDTVGIPGGQPSVITSDYDTTVVYSAGVYQVKAKKNCVFKRDQNENNRIFTFQTTTSTGNVAQWSTNGNDSISNSGPTLYFQNVNIATMPGEPQPPGNPPTLPYAITKGPAGETTLDINPSTSQSPFKVGNGQGQYALFLDNGSVADFDNVPNGTKWQDVGLELSVEDVDGNLIDATNVNAGFYWRYQPGCGGSCVDNSGNNIAPYPYYWFLEFDPNNAPSSIIPLDSSNASNKIVYLRCTGVDAATGGDQGFAMPGQPLVENPNSMRNHDYTDNNEVGTGGSVNEGRLKIEIKNSYVAPVDYDCINGVCEPVAAGTGAFATLPACQASNCGFIPWECINGNCIQQDTGQPTQYVDEPACLAACASPTENEPDMHIQIISCHSGGQQIGGYSEPTPQFNPYQYDNVLPANGTGNISAWGSIGPGSIDSNGCIKELPKALGFGITHPTISPSMVGPNGSYISTAGIGGGFTNNGLNFAGLTIYSPPDPAGRCAIPSTGGFNQGYVSGFGSYPNGTGISNFSSNRTVNPDGFDPNGLPLANDYGTGAALGSFAIASAVINCPCLATTNGAPCYKADIPAQFNRDYGTPPQSYNINQINFYTGLQMYYTKWGIGGGPSGIRIMINANYNYGQNYSEKQHVPTVPGVKFVPGTSAPLAANWTEGPYDANTGTYPNQEAYLSGTIFRNL